MPRQPIIPKNESDPTGTKRLTAAAINDFNRRIVAAFNGINKLIKELEYTKVQVNQSYIVVNGLDTCRRWSLVNNEVEPVYVKRELRTNETIYNYSLSSFELGRLNQTILDMINRLFVVDSDGNLVRTDNMQQLWLMNGYVAPAYERGTNQAFTNLTVQSPVYASAVQDVNQIFFSPEYQLRIGIVAAKEYQVIKGFSDDMVKDTTRILSDGIALGKSPREIASEIQSRTGAAKSKARLISQTEIPMALRQAGWAESDQASIDYGIKTMQMHMSAFKVTSRISHIARSGELHTSKETKEWYSKNGNWANCYCNQIVTVVDDKGKPLNDGAQKKLIERKEMYIKKPLE